MYRLSLLVTVLGLLASGANGQERFYWSSGEIGGKVHEKVAMLVPIEIEGVHRRLYAQLDTGADVTIFYGNRLRGYGVAFDSSDASSLSFRWYGLADGSGPMVNPFMFIWSMGGEIDTTSTAPGDNIVGTIGLDQAVDKILVLDFPEAEFAVFDDTLQIETVYDAQFDYTAAVVSYNKLYVEIPMGDDTIPAVRYDCGASIANLILPRDWWEWATGMAVDSPAVSIDSVRSWGKYVPTYTAQSQFDLVIGQVDFGKPEMMYIDWPDPNLANEKLMGNAPFYDDCIVAVDCIRQQFGVSRR